jgi:hypothetical protein
MKTIHSKYWIYIAIVVILAGGCGIAVAEPLTLSDYITSGIKNIAPIYADLQNNFSSKDYEHAIENTHKLKRMVEHELEITGYYNGELSKSIKAGLTKKEGVVFAKYEGFLFQLKTLSEAILPTLSWVNDASSNFKRIVRFEMGEEALDDARAATYQLDALLKACDEYGVDCNGKSSEVKELKRPLQFFGPFHG